MVSSTSRSTRALVHNGRLLAGYGVRVADSWWRRAVGLLATPSLSAGQGLWIAPCSSVHSIGMRYSIDLVFVDRAGEVRKLVHGLKPFRLAACWGAAAVLELRDGAIKELSICVGDVVLPGQHPSD